MAPYSTSVTLGDFGPWVSQIVLDCGAPVSALGVRPESFNVWCERFREGTDELVTVVERPSLNTHQSRGYVRVLGCHVCDENGEASPEGVCVALDLEECELTSRINVASVTQVEYVENRFRVTQVEPLEGPEGSVQGLLCSDCSGTRCEQLGAWSHGCGGTGKYEFGYAAFDPHHGEVSRAEHQSALVVWLHGASDGGADVRLPYTASHVTLLGESGIQAHFLGGAWVLVPQCPTFWMDDGVEQMGRSNKSIYTESLKALIDEFVLCHPDIDPERIVIGGLSNGGFMTLRMLADYPEAFCAGVAACAPLFEENQSEVLVSALAQTPIWLVHSKDDFIVNARETVLPLYHKLEVVSDDVHLTYYDHVEDLTGRYNDEQGRPRRNFGHGVWINVFNDFCHTELDGRNVIDDGEPVSIWEWAARKARC